MPILVLPPTFMVTENPEIGLVASGRAKNFQDTLLNELAINANTPEQTVKFGAYRGTRVFKWNQNYNAFLATFFLFPNGKSQNKEYIQTAALIREGDCLFLGGIWKVTTPGVIAFPIADSNVKLAQIAARTFQDKSPVRFESVYNFRSQERLHHILDLHLGESFAKEGLQTLSNINRIVCKAEFLKELKFFKEWEYPSRAHQVILMKFMAQGKDWNVIWPQVTQKAQLNSGVFGEKHEQLFEQKSFEIFDPLKIVQNTTQKLLPKLQDLKNEEFKIIRRYRGWVYLNRGRAFGLQIGMRLVGPNKSKLHIIRYLPEVEGEMDSSIAFIRYEDDEKPIQVGDVVKLDPSVYPKRVIPNTQTP